MDFVLFAMMNVRLCEERSDAAVQFFEKDVDQFVGPAPHRDDLDLLSKYQLRRYYSSHSQIEWERPIMAQGMEFVEYVTDQVDDSCKLTHRMMFGGCTLYLDGKVLVLESRRARGVEKGKTAR